jgi:hypothetical protein
MVALIVTRGYTYARYVSNAVFNYYLSSKGFYFESEDLTFDTKKHVDTMWDGEKIYFTLSNSANDALASEVDITYKVECFVNDEDTNKQCIVNGTGESSMEATLSASFGCSDGSNSTEEVCLENKKEWVSKPAIANVYFEVIDVTGADVLNANVDIIVTSIKPYSKELRANYSLLRDNNAIGNLSMIYEEGIVNSNLIVTNSYNEDKCVLVSWDPVDFSFDNKNANVLGYSSDIDGNINSVYFKITKMNSTNLEFFAKDSSVEYNELYFKLVESNLCE